MTTTRDEFHDSKLLSVIILTYNEETTLPDCLASLRDLSCDVFVVDSHSTDRTTDIAAAAGAVVVTNPFTNYSVQRNWALEHLPIRTEWVLHLDADERLTPPLVAEISSVLRNVPRDVSGFFVRRRTVFMDRWIRHGGQYPSYQMRLFRMGSGYCEDRLYDQHFLVDGTTNRLRHDYVNIACSDLSEWSNRHVRWADLEAEELLKQEDDATERLVTPALFGNPPQRRRWVRRNLYGRAPLLLRAFLYWFYRYFVRFGFLDGRAGLVYHFLQGFWYRFLVDAKILEKRRMARSTDSGSSRHSPGSRSGLT